MSFQSALLSTLFLLVMSTAVYGDKLTIVAFGDSTTASRSTVDQVYADRLPVLLQARGIEAKVINAGIGGSHTGRLADNARHRRKHALDRFDEAVRNHKPDVVVVQFGWNDSWIDSDNLDGPSRIPVKDYAANLKHITETLKKDGSKVILMTPNRPNTSVEEWRVARTQQYVDAVRNLAATDSVPLVDVWAEYERFNAGHGLNSDNLLLDRVHPNDKGHELVARLLADSIGDLKAAKSQRPNVLFIAIDDLRPELGCYGHGYAKSPGIDRLASQGVLFARAYCQQPLCNPSRTSVMTGMRPESTGVLGNHVYFRGRDPFVATLPQHFRNHGYTSVGIGKLYHGPFVDEAVCSTWDRLDDPLSWSEPAIRFGPRYYFTDQGIAAARRVFDASNPKADHDSWQNSLLFGPMTEAPDVPDNSLYDGKVGDAAVAKLRELNAAGKPFFLGVGFIKPHTPFIAPKKYWDLYDPETIPLAKNPEYPETSPAIGFHSSGEIRRYTNQPKRAPFTEENRRRLKHGYLACISHMDAQVGRVLDELDRLKLAENTIVVLWGDHGYHLGEQNMWGKHTSFENAARVPLIVRAPNSAGNGRRSKALVELVDLYPTLVDLAGLPAPDQLEGISFREVLDQPDRKWKTAVFTDQPARGNWDQGGSIIGRSMRTDRYRYTEWVNRSDDHVVARQLFDHEADPMETNNLAADSQNQDLVERLQRQLTTGWQDAAGPAFEFGAQNTPAASGPPERVVRGLTPFRDWQHPDKTFIGRAEKVFDFLGYQIQPRNHSRPARLTVAKKTKQQYVSRVNRLYEQGSISGLIEGYVRRWRCWARSGLEQWATLLTLDDDVDDCLRIQPRLTSPLR